MAILTLLLPAALGAQATIPLDVELPHTPAWSLSPDGPRLLVELRLTNFWEEAVDVLSITVRDTSRQAPLRSYDAALLRDNVKLFAAHPDSVKSVRLGAGEVAVAFLNVAAPADEAPDLQFDVVAVTVARARPINFKLQSPVVSVRPLQPVVIGAPVRGPGWAVFLGPDTMRTHAHHRLLVGSALRVMSPQRFALDLVKFGADGRLWRGDRTRNTNWTTFGEELLAVANGTIIEAVDSLPDNNPPDYQRGSANRVVLQMSDGRSAVYAHLKQGSLRVRVGASVTRGDVLAAAGNSGNSTGPHLHFHVLDAPSSIAGNGVPFVFDRYTERGELTLPLDDYEEKGAVWRARGSHARVRMLPNNAQVIDF